VNVTLGLPIIRSSVDHGTALDWPAAAPKRAPGSRRANGSQLWPEPAHEPGSQGKKRFGSTSCMIRGIGDRAQHQPQPDEVVEIGRAGRR